MIQVYTTYSCAYCKTVKEFLNKKGYSYEEINLNEQPERFKEVQDLTGSQTVPVTLVKNGTDQTVVKGWNPSQLIPALVSLDVSSA